MCRALWKLARISLLVLLGGSYIVRAEPLSPPLGAGEPAQGVLLVADHAMPDRRFQRTVILLLEHDDRRGTLGIVLNRPIELTLDDIAPETGFSEHIRALRVQWGGPVAQENLFMLFRADSPPAGAKLITDDLYWSTSQETLSALDQSSYDQSTLRLYIGAAGWSPGQLEGELESDGWKLFAMQRGAVFHEIKDAEGQEDRLWRHFIDLPTQLMANIVR